MRKILALKCRRAHLARRNASSASADWHGGYGRWQGGYYGGWYGYRGRGPAGLPASHRLCAAASVLSSPPPVYYPPPPYYPIDELKSPEMSRTA